MEAKNQLFIHPTDSCTLNCPFCIYAGNHSEHAECAKLELDRGYASESMKNLIKGAQHIAFSGGGEPLLNVDAIIESILLNESKKYMITTGLGYSLTFLADKLTEVDEACKKTNSLCVLRISIDSFHGNLDFGDDVDEVITWFVEKKWQRVRTCFIRGTVSEGKKLLKNLKKYCFRKHKFYVCKKINEFTYAFVISGKFFQVILRPTIYPSVNEALKEAPTLEYLDKLFQIDTEDIILGKPRSCRGCKGCDGWKDGLPNGLDVTVNARGDIYLYGAEVKCLGNIYNELIDYSLLNKRVRETPELVKIQSVGIKTIMEKILNDKVVGKKAREINYPFAIIRECMKTNPEDILRIISKI